MLWNNTVDSLKQVTQTKTITLIVTHIGLHAPTI